MAYPKMAHTKKAHTKKAHTKKAHTKKAHTKKAHTKKAHTKQTLETVSMDRRSKKTCLKVTHEEHQSIDEIVTAFKGKSSLREYLPAKPQKWDSNCGANVKWTGSCTTLICIRVMNQLDVNNQCLE